MVQRLILDNSGLKISRPGVNVVTATSSFDLLFNSDLIALNRLTWGTTVVPASGGPPNTTPGSVTISYGVTLTELPFVSALVFGNTGHWDHIGRAEDAGTVRMLELQVGLSSFSIVAILNRPAYSVRYSVWIT